MIVLLDLVRTARRHVKKWVGTPNLAGRDPDPAIRTAARFAAFVEHTSPGGGGEMPGAQQRTGNDVRIKPAKSGPAHAEADGAPLRHVLKPDLPEAKCGDA
jgi:hypothetical protein